MTAKHLFVDTAPFIYFLENHPLYAQPVSQLFQTALSYNLSLSTSVISFMEYTVQPYRQGRQELVQAFHDLVQDLDMRVHPIELATSDQAARLRAQHENLKGMDALQLSCAIRQGCDAFITNDKALRQAAAPSIITLDTLPKFIATLNPRIIS